ncbi:MAG TPA: hypothetical protein VGD40_18240 [Chryseosolibacter sp.]
MKNLLSFAFILMALVANAQYDPDYKKKIQPQQEDEHSPFNVGLGIGLDYGVIGAKVAGYPIERLGLFAGAGYNLLGVGYNFGAIGKILPRKRVCPYVTGMYGINAVIVVVGADEYNESYTGPTFGGGIELRVGQNQNFMNFGLLVPVRSQEFYDDWDIVNANPTIETTDPLPVGLSIGYHFKFQ